MFQQAAVFMFYPAFLLMGTLSSRGGAAARTVEGPGWLSPSKPRFFIFVGDAPVKVISPIIAVALMITAIACGKRPFAPEVYIPSGMPVTVDVSRDEGEIERIKYIIHSKVGLDVDQVKLLLFTTDAKHKDETYSGDFNMAVINKPEESASISWDRTQDVRRLIVIVQSVKTTDGIWVLDIPDLKQFPIQEVMENGTVALPKAKFINE
jgi:hypothetical protein